MRRILVLIVLCIFAASCVPDYGYVGVDYAPGGYESYPSTYYDGGRVYYVDGRWYARHSDRWVYYSREPPELYRYRQGGYHAPPAYYRSDRYDRDRRGREHYRAPPARYSAPPARHSAPPARYSAPPARRSAPYRAPPARHSAPPARYSAPPADR